MLMESNISFQIKVLAKQTSIQVRVMDKWKSFTTELMKNEHGLQERKIESNHRTRGDTPLHFAVRGGNLARVQEILLDLKTNGFVESIWKKNNDGHSALFVAAENGRTEIVREILKIVCMQSAAANVDRSCDAFHVAAKLGHAGRC